MVWVMKSLPVVAFTKSLTTVLGTNTFVDSGASHAPLHFDISTLVPARESIYYLHTNVLMGGSDDFQIGMAVEKISTRMKRTHLLTDR